MCYMPPKNPDTGRQRQNAEIRKPEIIKSFYRTILEQGFEGASIAKVAARIQIHPSLILHYFGSKDNLTLELVDYVIHEYARLFQTVNLKGLSPDQRLEKLLEVVWSRQYYEKIHIAASFAIIAVSFKNPAIHKKLQTLYDGFERFLINEIKVAADAGIIDIEDPACTARRIITLIEGARHFRQFFVSPENFEKYNQEMRTATRLLLEN